MELTLEMFLIVCPLVFLGAFVDSIAGGGGLITLPAYLLAGLPPHFAIGTNKLSSAVGTTVSTVRFCKNKFVDWGIAIPSIVLALIGSALGANLVLLLNEKVMQKVLIAILPVVAVYVLSGKSLSTDRVESAITRKKVYLIA